MTLVCPGVHPCAPCVRTEAIGNSRCRGGLSFARQYVRHGLRSSGPGLPFHSGDILTRGVCYRLMTRHVKPRRESRIPSEARGEVAAAFRPPSAWEGKDYRCTRADARKTRPTFTSAPGAR